MSLDRVINAIPLTIEGNINGYWVVKSMSKSDACDKCAFNGKSVKCPAVYWESDDSTAPKKRGSLLCTCFGDSMSIYFAEVEDDEIN